MGDFGMSPGGVWEVNLLGGCGSGIFEIGGDISTSEMRIGTFGDFSSGRYVTAGSVDLYYIFLYVQSRIGGVRRSSSRCARIDLFTNGGGLKWPV